MSFSFTKEESKRLFNVILWTKASSSYAARGDIEGRLKFLEETGYYLPFSVLSVAAGVGQLELVKWLIEERSIAFDEGTMMHAVKGGHLETVQFLYSKGYKWNYRVFFRAVCSGRVKIVEWLYEKNCPVGVLDPILEAAMRGNKEMIICLGKLGFCWSAQTLMRVQNAGYHELCQWMKENGCPTS